MKTIINFFLSFFRNTQITDIKSFANKNLRTYSEMSLNDIFQDLQTNEEGLVSQQVNERLETYGLNEISYERPPTWYQLLLNSYFNPFNILVSILGAISYFLEDINGMIIILAIVTISVGIRFIQELRSNNAAEKLKAMVSTKATVIRRADFRSPSTKLELPIQKLVPGDILFLSAGDMLPADVRLISSKELSVSQSALTGEAMAVDKLENPLSLPNPTMNLLDIPSMCYMGTNVLNGRATAVIVATGDHTYFGSMARRMGGERPLTSFDIGINKVTWLLIRFMLIMVPIVFMLNGFTKGDWFESFLFSLSIAVGLIPEMLPMVVTTNLARGAVKMAQYKVIVKRLNSIQNFGAMDILCADKTGTLTQDRIILEKHLNFQGDDDEKVLEFAYLNSFYQTGLKNLLDAAVLEHCELAKELQLGKAFCKVDEIPFDFNRRRMSVIVEKTPEQHLLICKGAAEEMIEICSEVNVNGNIIPLKEEQKQLAIKLHNDLNEDGLRVLAVAYKEIPIETHEYKAKDEHSLILMGFLAFLDPPKQTAQEAIAELQKLHVQVKILTGDNETITRKICKWVGLEVTKALNGHEIDKMSDAELRDVIDETTIFTKFSPLQKSRVLNCLKANGHTVGFLGDGINDAPSLSEADVGISVDTAADIAKECADIIMLEKSLLFLKDGALEGRRTFGNIIKYIKMAVSSNFGNVFSVLGASAMLPFLPMLPLQILVQNLLYDISQITIPFDAVDKDFLIKPRKWHPGGIARFMIFIGPISSIFDYTTFVVLWFVFGANSIENQALFQSGWFVEGLLSQTLIVHMIRTRKIPFFESIASVPLLLSTVCIMGTGIYLPYTKVGAGIGMVPLPFNYFYWLAAILICYCVLVQIVKTWFIKKYHYWL